MKISFSLNYIQSFKEKAASFGYEEEGPQYYIDEWKEFVDWCVDYGYTYTYFEFDEDTIVRDQIEKLSHDKKLIGYESHNNFIYAINEQDDKLKSIAYRFLRKERPWWKTIILKYACDSYVENVKHLFDADIDIFPKETDEWL